MESLVKKGTVGEVLFKSKIISENDIGLALAEQARARCRFGEALVRLGIVDQEDIDWALSNQLDIPYVRLQKEMIDIEAARLVPGSIARKHKLIPIIRTGDELHIAIADPLDKIAIAEVERITGCRVTISMPVIRELMEMMDIFYEPSREESTFGYTSAIIPQETLDEVNSDTSGMRMLDHLILFLLQNSIDAVFLQPSMEDVRISTRNGRSFRETGRLSLNSYPDLLSCIRSLAHVENCGSLANEGKVVYRIHDIDLLLRVSMIGVAEGECVTIRLWSDHSLPERIECMESDPATCSALHSLTETEDGMVLFASWNVNERSRLMDLYLDRVATDGKNVLVIGKRLGSGAKKFPCIPCDEADPGVMETLMRVMDDHDPDIIAIEDATAGRVFHAAWKAAMRNRIVLAGLSCDGIQGAADYLMNEQYYNHSVMQGIRGIISCTGVRTLCPHCRVKCLFPGDSQEMHGKECFTRGLGCSECGYSGLRGMKYLLDVMTVDKGIRLPYCSTGDGAEYMAGIHSRSHESYKNHLAAMLRNGDISPDDFSSAGIRF
jgi:type IV pilus assembly protein PilB